MDEEQLIALITAHLGSSEEDDSIPNAEPPDEEFEKIRGIIGNYNTEGML